MLRNVLILGVLGVSVFSAENNTVYLEDHCNRIVDQSIDNRTVIRLARSRHSGEQSCRVQLIFHAEDNAHLFVSFSEFQLTPVEDPSVCIQHFVQIGGLADKNRERRVCGNPPLESLNQFLLRAEEVKSLYYSRTVPLGKDDSIELTLSTVAFADKNGSCPILARANDAATDFRCESDNLCIPDFLRCDRIPNCGDGSDERDCIGTTTTEPSTTTTVTSLSPNKEIARGGDRQSGSSKKPHIIIGTVGGIVILALVAVIALFLVRRNKRRYHNVTTTHVPETTAGSADNVEINTALRQPADSTV